MHWRSHPIPCPQNAFGISLCPWPGCCFHSSRDGACPARQGHRSLAAFSHGDLLCVGSRGPLAPTPEQGWEVEGGGGVRELGGAASAWAVAQLGGPCCDLGLADLGWYGVAELGCHCHSALLPRGLCALNVCLSALGEEGAQQPRQRPPGWGRPCKPPANVSRPSPGCILCHRGRCPACLAASGGDANGIPQAFAPLRSPWPYLCSGAVGSAEGSRQGGQGTAGPPHGAGSLSCTAHLGHAACSRCPCCPRVCGPAHWDCPGGHSTAHWDSPRGQCTCCSGNVSRCLALPLWSLGLLCWGLLPLRRGPHALSQGHRHGLGAQGGAAALSRLHS